MDDTTSSPSQPGTVLAGVYEPPDVTVLGTVAELTQKDVGASDGTTFLGLDTGS